MSEWKSTIFTRDGTYYRTSRNSQTNLAPLISWPSCRKKGSFHRPQSCRKPPRKISTNSRLNKRRAFPRSPRLPAPNGTDSIQRSIREQLRTKKLLKVAPVISYTLIKNEALKPVAQKVARRAHSNPSPISVSKPKPKSTTLTHPPNIAQVLTSPSVFIFPLGCCPRQTGQTRTSAAIRWSQWRQRRARPISKSACCVGFATGNKSDHGTEHQRDIEEQLKRAPLPFR